MTAETDDPLSKLIAESTLTEKDFEAQRLASLQLRERFLSNPRCHPKYRAKADDLGFWLNLQNSQGALI